MSETRVEVETTKWPPIRVWHWDDAPDEYRKLSTHGGDEDWVAHIPREYVAHVGRGQAWIGWCESGTPFGCCDVSAHRLDDGSEVRIGAHA